MIRRDSDEIKDQLIKNSFWNFINSLINRFGSFILVILISKILMPEGFGRYSLALSVALFFITFSDMGVNQTLIRYVSFGIHKKSGESSSYLKYLLKIKFLLTVLFSLLMLILSYPLSVYMFHDTELFIPLLVLSFYVFIVSLTGFFESLFFLKKNVKYISAKETVLLILKLIAVIFIGYVTYSQRLVLIFLSFFVFSIGVFLFDFYLSKHFYPYLFSRYEKEIDKKEIRKFIFSLNIQNISLTILSQATIIILGIFLSKDYIGYYNSSLILVTSIANLFMFSSVLLPILTKMNENDFPNFIKKIFNLIMTVLLPISFGLALLSRYFIFFIYGENYLAASTSLAILAFLIPFMSGVDLALASFLARNKQKKFSILMFSSTILLIASNYLFITLLLSFSPESVLVGVSWANLLTWGFCFAFSVFLLKKELKVQIISSWIIKPILSCLIMSGFLFLSLNSFGEMNMIKGIILILFGAGIYFSSLYLMGGINKEEIKGIIRLAVRKK